MALAGASSGFAQERIYRCHGNVYTNDANEAKSKNCKPIDGANVSVIAAPKL